MTNEFVTISRAELAELREKVEARLAPEVGPAEPRVSQPDFVEAIREREAAHARELFARDQKSTELERAYKAALRDRELATALVGKPLVPGAAAQLIKLWRDDFEVVDEAGEIRILAKDGRAVDQTVDCRLSGPEFAHFCLPSSRGGTGSKGQTRSAESGARPSAPKNLGEAVLVQWRETASRSQTSLTPTGWGRRR